MWWYIDTDQNFNTTGRSVVYDDVLQLVYVVVELTNTQTSIQFYMGQAKGPQSTGSDVIVLTFDAGPSITGPNPPVRVSNMYGANGFDDTASAAASSIYRTTPGTPSVNDLLCWAGTTKGQFTKSSRSAVFGALDCYLTCWNMTAGDLSFTQQFG